MCGRLGELERRKFVKIGGHEGQAQKGSNKQVLHFFLKKSVCQGLGEFEKV